MRILYVAHQLLTEAFAGVELYTYNLAKELCKRGDRVNIAAMPHKLEHEFPRHKHNEPFGLIKIKKAKNQLKEFEAILRDFKPDIIHFQHLQYFSPLVIRIAKRFNIPTVLNLHDYFYICRRIRLLTKEGRVCGSAANCEGCRKNREKWKKHIKDIDLIIANSHFTREMYIKNGFTPEKITVNYPGINTSKLDKITHAESDDLRFGFLGSVIKEKGVEILIDVFNNLDDLSATLEIWGGASSYEDYLLKKIKNRNIQFKGAYSPDSLTEILSNLDVILIPSIWPETWSMVKTEAIAAGLGILASSVGGIKEGIRDDRVIFFKPNNAADMANAIKTVLANKDVWKPGKYSRRHVKTIEEDADGLMYVYRQLQVRYKRIKENKASKAVVNSRNIFWAFGQDCVEIYKLKSGELRLVYVLRNTAKRFWELFTTFKSFDEIVDTIAKEYNTKGRVVKKDIGNLVNELYEKEIIV